MVEHNPVTDKAPSEATIALREITKENLSDILKLKVGNHQQQFVASNAVSIAQAHFSQEVAWFRAIYADEVPVGFLMLEDDPDNASYYLWRFMIDERFQKRGFGKRALKLLIEHVKTRPGVTALLTSCVPGEGSPGKFYEKVGFMYTGHVEDEELVMRLEF
ncbi:MAG: GNAT family N-acetyltransferase [Cyanomargarita calcarea GSE-NOS-MK-12-04C]|uniref:GNAT family N-acetyltransferase n=1 Tax=Cyanomargarita calcarea GSE-NOS-MK-12-04C TaxID=2839659 RepID=A0A951QIC1_9CYAN|nr:GNAT family N-acetyltransferase [Cyanomargarita calcarea GSE-NOS-MK-12-04C]